MPYDSDRLSRRREERSARVRRRRLGAIGVLLAAVLSVAAVIALAGHSGTGGGKESSGGGKAAAKVTAATGTSAASDWKAPYVSPEKQAAAVARIVRIGKPVYCAGGRNGRYIALTFDDGPGLYTHFALRYLKKWQMHATFFLIGRLLEDPSFRELAVKERTVVGAATGNHSWTHPYLPGLGIGEVASQVTKTKAKASSVSGNPVQVFRPPYGARTAGIDAVSSRNGMAEILWDIDSEDSQGANWAGIARNVIANMKPGSIVLMHENRGQTIRALRTILPAVRKAKLIPVTVPELLALDPPSDAQLRAGPNGCGNLRGHGAIRAGA